MPSLVSALLVSLVAHVLLLSANFETAPRPDAVRDLTMKATLAAVPVRRGDVSVDPVLRRPAPTAVTRPLSASKRRPIPAPPLPTHRLPDVAADLPKTQLPAAAAESVTTWVESQDDLNAHPKGDVRGPPGAPVPSVAPSTSDLATYRLELARVARNFKRYPPAARARGVTGVVEVSIQAERLPGGARAPVLASLRKSSGAALLDEAALALMEQAVAIAELPPALRGRAFELVLPIEYALGE